MPGVFYPHCRAIISVVFDGFGGTDTDPTIVQVLPKTCTVHLNSYKEADTWDMTFDAKLLPFSPELIRAMGVEIYAFDAGRVGGDPQQFATEENLLVSGLADNASIRLGSDGAEFSCDGRDYTALMLDRQWDPKKKVPVGKSIAALTQDLVDEACNAPKFFTRFGVFTNRVLTVQYKANTKEATPNHYETPTNKKGRPVGDGKNFWDVIYSNCARQGLVAFVRGFNVIITNPQTLTVANARKTRRMAYGRNLSSLSVDRKLGKEKVPQIIVRSYSPKTQKPIEAKFPENKDAVTTGVGTEKNELQSFVVEGVADIATLKKVAEARYNALARGEATFQFTTRDLRDMDESNLLLLRAGDSVAIDFDPFNEVEMRKLGTDQRYTYLTELGYEPPVASLIALEYDKIEQFKAPLYVREMAVNWSVSDGLTLDVEAMNFVSVGRDDVSDAGSKVSFSEIQESEIPLPDAISGA